MDIYSCMKQEQEYLIQWRREFHQDPELSGREYRTAGKIKAELERLGIESCRIGETGVLGVICGEGEGERKVALRADTDALPVEEKEGRAYGSNNPGVMHACGHDGHTACLLGAAKVLQENRREYGGQVLLLFQPGEETGLGAEDFLRSGVLDGTKRIFGLHMAPELRAGTIGIKEGLNNAAVDQFCADITGKAAHVSVPQMGADALYMACQAVVALQGIVTRRTSPTDPVIIGVGKMTAGSTYNAVASGARLEGTVRTISQESRRSVKKMTDETIKRTAELYGGRAEVTWTEIASPLICHAKACEEARTAANQIFGEKNVIADRPLSLGGDNFAEYLFRLPGAYAYLGSGNPAKPDTTNSLHHEAFDLDEAVLASGAAFLAACALNTLKCPE